MIPFSHQSAENICENVSVSPSLRALKWTWSGGARNKGGAGREMRKENWLYELTLGIKCGS